MMNENLMQVGVGGALALAVIKLILDFLTAQRKEAQKSRTAGEIAANEKLANAIKDLTDAVQALHIESKLNAQSLKAIARDLQEIKRSKPVSPSGN